MADNVSILMDGLGYLEIAQNETDRRLVINRQIVKNDKEVLNWLRTEISKKVNQQQTNETTRNSAQAEESIVANKTPHKVSSRSKTLEDVIARAKAIELQNSSPPSGVNGSSIRTSPLLTRFSQDSRRLLSSVEKWERMCHHKPWSSNTHEHIQVRSSYETEVSSHCDSRPSMRPSHNLDPLLAKQLGDELMTQIQKHLTDEKLESIYRHPDAVEAYRAIYRSKKLIALSGLLCEAMCVTSLNEETPLSSEEHNIKLDEQNGVFGAMKRNIPACAIVQFDRRKGVHLGQRNVTLANHLSQHTRFVETVTLTEIRRSLGATLLPSLLSQLKDTVRRAQATGVDDCEWKEALILWRLLEAVLLEKSSTDFFKSPSS